MWGFETNFPFEAGEWQPSKQRFDSIDDAATAAAQWMAVCAENDFITAVRLKRFED